MTPEQVDEAARVLAAARAGQPIAALPDAVRPQSEADSYAIQDAVLRRVGERIGGWKVGFSIAAGVKPRPSCSHPSCAPADDAARGSGFSSRSAPRRLMMG